MATWKSNDDAAVATEQKLAVQACIDSVTPLLTEFLGIDYHTKVRTAKIKCKSKWVECNEAAEKTGDPMPGYKVCRANFNQCGNRDIEPLVAGTPVGKCKVTYAACKKTVIDKARALNPGATPERIVFNPCWIEHNACVEATK
ncbi:hypothetical protein F2P44_28340 [Massilia sp. CCM 8695]|uniref:Uncharacterized protein n=1 Tax=Massilia frigida TaxID=2609281 RepID=A0ABX0NDH6_9BURK|nr:hypothetical protein [Massilia frigida]NHZ83154.1 hypothetical protein [Massilia frigida]